MNYLGEGITELLEGIDVYIHVARVCIHIYIYTYIQSIACSKIFKKGVVHTFSHNYLHFAGNCSLFFSSNFPVNPKGPRTQMMGF